MSFRKGLVFILIEESVIIFWVKVLVVIHEQNTPDHGDQVCYHPNVESKFYHVVEARNPQLANDPIVIVDLVICTSRILHGPFDSAVKVVSDHGHNSFVVNELEQLRETLALNKG